MKIKISVLLITLLIAATSVDAQSRQSRHMRIAEEAFDNMQYNKAAKRYRKAYSKAKVKPEKEYIGFKMAECYRITNNYRRAVPAYKRIIKGNYAKENPQAYLYLAQMLVMNQKYSEAKPFFEKYAEAVPDSPLGRNGIITCDSADVWSENKSKYKIETIKSINSRYSDFSPTYADKLYNTLIFTSTRDEATGKYTDDWTNENFSDLFITKIDPKGKWSTPVLIDNNEIINTEANEGNPHLNSKFNQLYFTRCTKKDDELQGCKIMVSKRVGRNWSEPVVIDLGGDSSTVFGTPALSPDELVLFFTSDLKNGYGGKDLWYASRKNVNSEFSKPRNMGDVINTPGDEMFPFMRNDSTLYFASNGHPGLGGLDIFVTKFSNGKWTKPVNVKAPINSNYDDFAIIFHPELDQGFFCSNRRGGRGGDDIYFFDNPPVVYTLSGIVKDDNSLQFVPNAIIKLIGSDGTTVQAKTDAKGFYSFSKSQIKPNTTYDLVCEKPNYFNKKAKETTVDVEVDTDFVINFNLEPIPDKPIVLPDILYDLAKWDLKPQYQDSLQGLIRTLDENETIIIELASHTDLRGSEESNDILSQKRAESVVNYLIDRGIDPDRLVAKGYGERVPRTLSEDRTYDGFTFKAGTKLTEEFINSLESKELQERAHELNRRTEFRILSKDFVPKKQNKDISSFSKAVSIEFNPEVKNIQFTENPDHSISFTGVVNGKTLKITLIDEFDVAQISLDAVLMLLRSGAISKYDFEGDPEKIIGENTVANKAILYIAEINLGDNSAFEIETEVNHKLNYELVINRKILRKFGAFNINYEKNQIIFQ
ncbi:MAG: OmpA family protein [Bacteroidales bacterium]